MHCVAELRLYHSVNGEGIAYQGLRGLTLRRSLTKADSPPAFEERDGVKCVLANRTQAGLRLTEFNGIRMSRGDPQWTGVIAFVTGDLPVSSGRRPSSMLSRPNPARGLSGCPAGSRWNPLSLVHLQLSLWLTSIWSCLKPGRVAAMLRRSRFNLRSSPTTPYDATTRTTRTEIS
ncbi:MAG: hypothetical protein ABFE13_14780 [Phycisphaerales bacterium]